MRRSKCPSGVLCIETCTMIFLLFVAILIATYFLYRSQHHQQRHQQQQQNHSSPHSIYSHYHNNLPPHNHIFNIPSQNESGYNMLRPIMRPNISYNDNPQDTLMNPYSPPLQYNQPHKYRQIGYLKSEAHNNKMLPIFAKPAHIRRDKWYYYTIFDNIKLPIYSNGRKCSSEHGCDSLMDGDKVNLENMGDAFTVSLYDNNTLTYDPHI